MKVKILSIALLVVVWTSAALAQTKLKVAYPTMVGSMAVLWVAKDARLFEKHGLDVELIYVAGSSKVVQAMLAKEIPISEIAIPAVIQANLAVPIWSCSPARITNPVKRSWSSRRLRRRRI